MSMLLACCTALAAIPNAEAQQNPAGAKPQFGVRDIPAGPPASMRLYHPEQLVMKVEPGVSQADVLNRVVGQNKESFQGGNVIATPFGDGAFVLNVAPLLRQKESTGAGGRFAMEPVGGPKEAATPGSLDDLIARISADPGVVYVQKNYLRQPQQSGADLLNDMIGGSARRVDPEPEEPVAREQPSDPAPEQPVAREQPPGSAPEQPEAPRQAAGALPDDPFLVFEWHLRNSGPAPTADSSPGGVGFPVAWGRQQGSADVIIAVLDTGLLLNHEEFAGSAGVLPGADMISEPFIANDGDGRDLDALDTGDATAAGECAPGSAASGSSWHGSHVAGIIGGPATNNAVGVSGGAWNARILPIRVLGKCGGTDKDIADGMLWAAGIEVEGLPVNANPAHIINMSLGGGGACTPFYQDVIDQVVARGVTVIVAAGNEAQDAANFLPASCNNVINVAASDARGHIVARYSNFGDTIDILAPGGDVQRDDDADGYPDGVLGPVESSELGAPYDFYNGTSMATPVVAAAAALLKSSEPALSPAEIEERLKNSATPRTTEQCGQKCGAGLLDVSALIHCSPPTDPGPQCPSAAVAAAGGKSN
jgi:subtilisin family serine protease